MLDWKKCSRRLVTMAHIALLLTFFCCLNVVAAETLARSHSPTFVSTPSTTILPLLPFQITLEAKESYEFEDVRLPLKLAMKLYFQTTMMSLWGEEQHRPLNRVLLTYQDDDKDHQELDRQRVFNFSGEYIFMENYPVPSMKELQGVQREVLQSGKREFEQLLLDFGISLVVKEISVRKLDGVVSEVPQGQNYTNGESLSWDDDHKLHDDEEGIQIRHLSPSFWLVAVLIIGDVSICFSLFVCKRSKEIAAKLELKKKGSDERRIGMRLDCTEVSANLQEEQEENQVVEIEEANSAWKGIVRLRSESSGDPIADTESLNSFHSSEIASC